MTKSPQKSYKVSRENPLEGTFSKKATKKPEEPTERVERTERSRGKR